MNNFDKLITYLMAIEGKAKDIHYNCSGADLIIKNSINKTLRLLV